MELAKDLLGLPVTRMFFHPTDIGALMSAPQTPLLSPCVRTALLESIPRHQVYCHCSGVNSK